MRIALFDFRQTVDYRLEVLSGLTVAMALIPEAVAFALIAGLSPLTGLYAAFVVGLVASVFGGRPGMISGATGAVAVVAKQRRKKAVLETKGCNGFMMFFLAAKVA